MNDLTLKNDDKPDFFTVLRDNTDIALPVAFYGCGVLIGSYFFNILKSTFVMKAMTELFEIQTLPFETMFVNRFCLYFSIFALTVILGMCLIGFPFLNIIPLIIGLETGLKVAYYYSSFHTKGIGYALLMIIPEASALITVIVFTIRKSLSLSKSIYSITAKKSDTEQDIDLKLYLKSFLVYSLVLALTSVVNTALFCLLGSIITI